MKLADLREVKHPRDGKRACTACKAFAAECQVPIGEGSAAMCWLCAHHVVDHEVAIHEAATAECECTPENVYPMRVLQARVMQLEECKARGYAPLASVASVGKH